VTPPSPEHLQRELEQLRAAQPPPAAAAQPTVSKLLARSVVRVLLLWFFLVCAFLAIWLFLAPMR